MIYEDVDEIPRHEDDENVILRTTRKITRITTTTITIKRRWIQPTEQEEQPTFRVVN